METSSQIVFDGNTAVALETGERVKRASLLEDEHTRDEVREIATDSYIYYIYYKANPPNSFGSLVSFVFSLKMCLAPSSLGAELNSLINACVATTQTSIDSFIAGNADTVASYNFEYDHLVAVVNRRSENVATGGSVFEVEFENSFEHFPTIIVSDNNLSSGGVVEVETESTGVSVVGGICGIDLAGIGASDVKSFAFTVGEDMGAATLASLIANKLGSGVVGGVSASRSMLNHRSQTSEYLITFSNFVGDVGQIMSINEESTLLTGTGAVATVTGVTQAVSGQVAPTADSLVISLDDGTNSASKTIKIYTNPANDFPTIATPVTAVRIFEDESLSLSGVISVEDVDDTILTLSLGCLRGIVRFDEEWMDLNLDLNLLSITGGAASTSSVSVRGEIGVLNDLLSKASYSPGANYNGNEQLTVTAADNSGGVNIEYINVIVVAVNDGPTILAPSAILANSNVETLLNGITVVDVDVGER